MATVLIVDDHPDLREVVGQLLKAHGLDVRCSPSAEQALDDLSAGDPPRAMIVDLRLPGLSGLEFVRHVRNQGGLRAVPVIVYSADDSQRAEAETAGCDEFWLKGSEAMFDGVARLGARLLAADGGQRDGHGNAGRDGRDGHGGRDRVGIADRRS